MFTSVAAVVLALAVFAAVECHCVNVPDTSRV